jgi:CheY-like chemotaxis protein
LLEAGRVALVRSAFPPPPATGTRAKRRALIVEDDEDARELYAWCLRAAGWVVEVVNNGCDALHVAETFAPDVIVMDLRLPLLGGIDASRQLKKKGARTQHVPIVVCTAADPASAEALASEVGCDEFVAKPCTAEFLLKVIEELLDTARSAG